MNVVDLAPEHKTLFSVCLEDWSDEAREGGTRRAAWIDKMLPRGLHAKLALNDAGTLGGMVQYLPIEHSFVQGEGLYFMPCIWVHGHKQGRGNLQKQGMGSAMLESAEADARARGATGMAAWGVWLPFWMKASWFKKHGYRKADRQGLSVLLWKPFTPDAKPPRWYPRGKTLPDPVAGKVNVTAFSNGWCLASNLTTERAKRAAAELGDKVVFREVDTSERSAVAQWGFSDALFVDGKPVGSGPPPSYEKIRSVIAKRVARL